jgi:hypothetical protein
VVAAGYSPDEVVNRVKALGWACLLHTSHNHKPGDIRFRIVLPLSEEIAHELPPPEVAAGALWLADGCCSLRPPNRASNPHFVMGIRLPTVGAPGGHRCSPSAVKSSAPGLARLDAGRGGTNVAEGFPGGAVEAHHVLLVDRRANRVGLVLIEMPGSSKCTTTSWRLATWRTTFARVRSSPHVLRTCMSVCTVAKA